MNGKVAFVKFLRSDLEGALAAATGSAPLVVDGPKELGAFLDAQLVPRWRQRLMFEHRVVTVVRTAPDGHPGELAAVGSSTPVVRGDRVEIDERYPPFVAALDRYAREARDVVFVADIDADDPYIKPTRDVLERRGAVIVDHIDTGPDLSLQHFVRELGQGAGTRPPKDLHVVSHTWHTGSLLFSPTLAAAEEGKAVTWEVLDQAGDSLRIPNSYLDPRTGPEPKLIVRGCEAARSAPLLRKLRNLMNPRLEVYAPVHFVGANSRSRGPNLDLFEYMCKPCYVHSKIELTRAEVIDDLLAHDTTDANDKKLTRARLGELVPAEPWDDSVADGSHLPATLAFTMPKVRLPGGGNVAEFVGSFEIGGMYRWPMLITGTIRTTATAAEFADRPVEVLRAAVTAVSDPRSRLHPDHPFPLWFRARFADAGTMIDGFDWEVNGSITYTPGPPARLEAKGWGVKYCVLVPVQAPAAANVPHARRRLRVNYYADGATIAQPEDLSLSSQYWVKI